MEIFRYIGVICLFCVMVITAREVFFSQNVHKEPMHRIQIFLVETCLLLLGALFLSL